MHGMTVAAFISIVLLHLMGAISPGPAFMMTVRTAAAEGFRPAAFAALGLGAGAVCWALAALVGLNLLFELAPATLFGFKLLGAAFLLWIAWQTIRHADAPLPQIDSEGRAPRAAPSAFRLGLFTQLANPKVAVFFGSIFLGMVPDGTPIWEMGAILAVILLDEFLWYSLVGRVFSLPRVRSGYAHAKRWVDRAFGVAIAAFGLRIAVT
jgi:threonine/homoserine/homoserine lactone efflux protein